MFKEQYYPTIKKALGILFFYGLLCPIILGLIVSIASEFIGFSPNDPLVSIIISIAGLGLLIAWIKRKYIIGFKSMINIDKVYVIYLLPMTFTIVGLHILLSELDNFVRRIFPMSDFWIKIFNDAFGNSFAAWKGILLVVIVVPIVEEIVFRGIVLKGFLEHYTIKKSIFVSALLFGIIHMNPWQFVSASAAGIILGWWYVKTDSIVTTIFGHALNNSMGYIVGIIGLSIPGYNTGLDIVKHQPLWFNTLGIILLIVGVVWFVKLFNGRRVSYEISVQGVRQI
jgi:membrane protease YdiL (CAAX protease family)